MLGRAAPRLWRAAQWAPHSDAASVVSSAFDSATSYCIHNPAQQLISLRAFSAFSSPHPALIRDFAIIGTQWVMGIAVISHDEGSQGTLSVGCLEEDYEGSVSP